MPCPHPTFVYQVTARTGLETNRVTVCVGRAQADTCRLVLLAGLVAMLLPLALMCFFDDDKTLGLLSESLQCAHLHRTQSLLCYLTGCLGVMWGGVSSTLLGRGTVQTARQYVTT
jgi:hypothetical protein